MNLPPQGGDKSVINLSKSFVLSPAQLSLLRKGLTFIPTKGSNKNLVYSTRFDMQQYHRKLKIAAYFEGKGDSDPPPFTPKSHWTPPLVNLPDNIKNIIQQDIQYFDKKFKIHSTKPNLSKAEVNALKSLQNNSSIVIKPADKGSAVVIMDRDQYIWEGNRQLMDKKYYTQLKKPIYPETAPMVEKIVQKLYEKKFINAKQKSYLIGQAEPRPRRFYMLPKIHKEPEKWSKPHEIPPGRPIVSDCSSETYYTAEYLDFYLNPLSIRHPSYIKDTYDFISKIKQLSIPPDAFLFTMDIDSLYTNIDIAEGIQAIKNIFIKYPDSKRPEKELLELLNINLTRNDFEFNNKYFLQIRGTAMGKKFAPAYANIFMAEWEQTALQASSKKPLYYYRYLDDIWGVWDHPREDFDVFLNILNNHNTYIKLKATIDSASVDFLDTTTYKGPNFPQTHKLEIKIFFKKTDTHSLLYKTSHHPKHTYSGIVKSQLLRFYRVCTREEDFRAATKVLFSTLNTRGYSRSFLRKSFKTFKQTRPIWASSLLPIITNYSISAVRLIRTIKRNFQQGIEHSQVLQNHRLIAAFRKNKNLQDYLVRAQLKPLKSVRPTGQGELFQHRLWVSNSLNNNVFKTQLGSSLATSNCVYLIFCTVCEVQYVGETGNTVRTRFYQYKYNICKQHDTHIPVIQHFIQHGWTSLRVTILEGNPRWSTPQRRRAERKWIRLLDTLQPHGLNEK